MIRANRRMTRPTEIAIPPRALARKDQRGRSKKNSSSGSDDPNRREFVPDRTVPWLRRTRQLPIALEPSWMTIPATIPGRIIFPTA